MDFVCFSVRYTGMYILIAARRTFSQEVNSLQLVDHIETIHFSICFVQKFPESLSILSASSAVNHHFLWHSLVKNSAIVQRDWSGNIYDCDCDPTLCLFFSILTGNRLFKAN